MHLFEPSAFTFKKLQATKWPSTIKLNHFGLGERADELLLHIASDGSGMNSIHQRHGVKCAETKAVEMIEIRTVDRYCEDSGIPRIDFLKIDVEGHELSVLRRGSKLLESRRNDYIQFEYGGCNLDARVFLIDIWNLLESFGYPLGKLHPNGIVMFDKYEQSLESFKYANYVAKVR